MKKHLLTLIALAAVSTSVGAKEPTTFEPNNTSLKQYECPAWFQDAKFGIWAHWGPQSVPMQGDWYARAMYEPDNIKNYKKDIYEYHIKHYGHPSEFGYKDIIPLWKAEKFDPEALMKLYKSAGAKYFVSMGVHHDNFDLWDSKYNRWNAANMGPKRDIVKAWSEAAKSEGLYFGISEHLSAGYSWWQANKSADAEGPMKGVAYDGADPKNWDLYYAQAVQTHKEWTPTNGMFAQLWYARMSDLIENYEFDLLYSDGALPFGNYGEMMLSDFYNKNIKDNKGKLDAVYLAKPGRASSGWAMFDADICVEDRERGGLADISATPWQTDTSIGDWFYNENWVSKDSGSMYRKPFWVLTTLVDIVSKNGNLLLNVLQRPDGSVDEEVVELLNTVGEWLDVNGEAIYSSRPWVVFGEGPQQRGEKSDWQEDFEYTPQDIRYTQDKKHQNIYATAMGMPNSTINMKEIGRVAESVKSVTLLGSKEKLTWEVSDKGLTINLPNLENCNTLPVFKISLK
ncbi:MAG: alpha-L-fucosidase [Rikenellaceae bacterium]